MNAVTSGPMAKRPSMLRPTGRFRRGLTVLVALSVMLWSIAPIPLHTPTLLQTLEDHAAFVAEHGHSHGFEEDIAAAMHGHSQGMADHDHGTAALTFGPENTTPTPMRALLYPPPLDAIPELNSRIDRPPRA